MAVRGCDGRHAGGRPSRSCPGRVLAALGEEPRGLQRGRWVWGPLHVTPVGRCESHHGPPSIPDASSGLPHRAWGPSLADWGYLWALVAVTVGVLLPLSLRLTSRDLAPPAFGSRCSSGPLAPESVRESRVLNEHAERRAVYSLLEIAMDTVSSSTRSQTPVHPRPPFAM